MMYRRRMPNVVLLVLALVAVAMPDDRAAAQPVQNCGNAELGPGGSTVTVTPSPNISSYNPYSGVAGSQSLTIRFARNNIGSGQPCRVGVFLLAGVAGKKLTNGASTLDYDVMRLGSSVLYTATPATVPIVLSVDKNSFQEVTVTFDVPANQVKPTGAYSDSASVILHEINGTNQPTGTSRSIPLAPQATVIKSCFIGTPSATTLSFAAGDIPNGLPNEGVVKSTSMPSSSCTAPANLKLTGQALVQTPAAPPRSGFDHFINYAAVGNFSTGSVTLNTTTSSQTVSSAAPIGTASSVVTGTVGVNVHLKRGQPVIAGSYSGILTVTLEPAP